MGTQLCVILLLIVLGILFLNGKGAFLIAGFNTKSKEEQAQYDQTALCKFMGKMTFALAFSIALWALSELFKIQFLFTVGMVFFIYIIVFMLIYLNTNNRFKK
jgi:Ca2+/Na+ antiporter